MDGMKCLFDADKPYLAAWLSIHNEDGGGPSMAVPLYYAATLGFRDLAEHLIAEHPEQVNGRGGRQKSPMHIAAERGRADILSLLIDHGAIADGRDGIGQTPLHRASCGGHFEAGKCLLDCGAGINARNNNDQTPLFNVMVYQHVEFARMLLRRGARVNDLDSSFGWTPLHCAVYKGGIQAARLLLEHGADSNAPDISGRIPSRMASDWGRHDIMDLLSEYGAKSVQ